MTPGRQQRHCGFSLIELVIVVVIIGIIAAIAIPRLSRGSAGAADAALAQNLATLRGAIDRFQAEHAGYLPPVDMIYACLTLYTDDTGTGAQANKDNTHLYGPYLRKIPPLPVGAAKGGMLIGLDDGNVKDPHIGWLYDPAQGTIRANCTTEVDSTGKLYKAY